jgi:hypothetical protein
MKSNQTKIKNFKALIVNHDSIIGARGYTICKYDLKTKKVSSIGKVVDKKYSLLSKFFLTRRFFRAEVTNLYDLNNGDQILIAKKGLFKKKSKTNKFIKVFHIPRGSRPLNLCVDTNNGIIYFGEYFSNFEKKAVHIYSSKDNGESWSIAYTFKEGNINHIHGLFYDKFTNNIWVVTGDRENECIIGYTVDGFKTFNEVFRGGQDYRTCNLLFYEDYIVYVTDSQYIQNVIKKFDRKTLKISELHNIHGSGIYAGQNNGFAFCSSTIEPSTVNLDKYSHLYVSKDGVNWKEIAKYKKDIWHKSAFQFGSIQFPRYKHSNENFIVYNGRALNTIGGNTIIQQLDY